MYHEVRLSLCIVGVLGVYKGLKLRWYRRSDVNKHFYRYRHLDTLKRNRGGLRVVNAHAGKSALDGDTYFNKRAVLRLQSLKGSPYCLSKIIDCLYFVP